MSAAGRATADVVSGACHHDCPDTCGWHVTVDRSGPTPVALQMRGDPGHPYSKGELCPKVNKFLDRVYSDDRVLHPLRRVGAKGDGQFEQISWDEALTEIAARFHDIIDHEGPEAIMEKRFNIGYVVKHIQHKDCAQSAVVKLHTTRIDHLVHTLVWQRVGCNDVRQYFLHKTPARSQFQCPSARRTSAEAFAILPVRFRIELAK